jgi:histidyl-tRNA synthetase
MSANQRKKITAIKGTKDILPSEARKWQKVESVARDIFELYGCTLLWIRGAGLSR